MTLGSRLHDNDEITEHTEYILPKTHTTGCLSRVHNQTVTKFIVNLI